LRASRKGEQHIVAVTVEPTDLDACIDPCVCIIDGPKGSNEVTDFEKVAGIRCVIIGHTKHHGQFLTFFR